MKCIYIYCILIFFFSIQKSFQSNQEFSFEIENLQSRRGIFDLYKYLYSLDISSKPFNLYSAFQARKRQLQLFQIYLQVFSQIENQSPDTFNFNLDKYSIYNKDIDNTNYFSCWEKDIRFRDLCFLFFPGFTSNNIYENIISFHMLINQVAINSLQSPLNPNIIAYIIDFDLESISFPKNNSMDSYQIQYYDIRQISDWLSFLNLLTINHQYLIFELEKTARIQTILEILMFSKRNIILSKDSYFIDHCLGLFLIHFQPKTDQDIFELFDNQQYHQEISESAFEFAMFHLHPLKRIKLLFDYILNSMDGIDIKGIHNLFPKNLLQSVNSIHPHHNISYQIIVARYQEDLQTLSWLQKYSHVIYDRDDRIEDRIPQGLNIHKDSLNVGRESMVYLNYIINHYEELPSYLICIQAGGNEIYDITMNQLQDQIVQFLSSPPPYNDYRLNDGFYYFGKVFTQFGLGLESDIIYLYHHLFRSLISFPISKYISPGAYFVVSKQLIYHHTKEEYILLQSLLQHENNPMVGYLFERMWPSIFQSDCVLGGPIDCTFPLMK